MTDLAIGITLRSTESDKVSLAVNCNITGADIQHNNVVQLHVNRDSRVSALPGLGDLQQSWQPKAGRLSSRCHEESWRCAGPPARGWPPGATCTDASMLTCLGLTSSGLQFWQWRLWLNHRRSYLPYPPTTSGGN